MRNESRAFTVEQFRSRSRIVMILLGLLCVALAARAFELQVLDDGFLTNQGDQRFVRVETLAAHRGSIYDRNGEPLAVSTPVDTVWASPKVIVQTGDQQRVLGQLSEGLNRDRKWLTQLITSNLDREFVYLERQMRPQDAAQVKALGIPGVYLMREYRRFYPAGEVTGHLLGFTKKYEDIGQEGLELAYDKWLGAEAGAKRVIRDRYGRTVEDIESIRPARSGQDLYTSIDLRIQYLAYREIKAAVQEYDAKAASAIVIDVDTGEVLAMVSQPAYNPNDRDQVSVERYRNRSATDIFEPGSSIKPFVTAAALATGRYHGNTIIDTSPGYIRVGVKTFRDEHDLGPVPITTIMAESSNVGMAKMALSIGAEDTWRMLNGFGFGHVTGSGFPGESAGLLDAYNNWHQIGLATLSHGYGLSVTPIQLAHAYAVLGAHGISHPVTLRRIEGPVEGVRVIDEGVARELIAIMENVVTEKGATGRRAALAGYRVAGKTGTAFKATAGGYSDDRYVGTFGGVVPATHPKLAALVMIDEPGGKYHHGGEVAAPVFANIMAGALRLLAVAPDGLDRLPASTLVQTAANP